MSAFDSFAEGLGIPPDQAAAAKRDGTLLGLIAEYFLLPGERAHDLTEMAELAGISLDVAMKLQRALGLPVVDPTAKTLTDADVEALRLFVGTSSVSDYVVHEVRVISGAMARIAEVMVDEQWDADFGSESYATALQNAGGVDMGRVERLLLYLLRRQLVAAIYRRVTLDQSVGSMLAVGFADLVGFTALSQRLEPAELARLVVLFEQTTHDIVADAGGRVVKTIGDEVMFSCDSPAAAALIATQLTTEMPSDLPPLRVAVAWGPVLVREGDCFGPTVNLASRLVGAAQPGEALVNEALHAALPGGAEFVDDVDLKGLGPVPVWRLVAR